MSDENQVDRAAIMESCRTIEQKVDERFPTGFGRPHIAVGPNQRSMHADKFPYLALYIFSLDVPPAQRGCGMATEMLCYVLELADREGVSVMLEPRACFCLPVEAAFALCPPLDWILSGLRRVCKRMGWTTLRRMGLMQSELVRFYQKRGFVWMDNRFMVRLPEG